MKKYILFIVAIIIYGYYIIDIQKVGASSMVGSTWFLNTTNQLQTAVNSWGLKIPSLSSSGNCLVTDSNGVVSTASCGTGGGGGDSTLFSFDTTNNQVYTDSASTTATTSLRTAYITATSTATSTFAGSINIGSNHLVAHGIIANDSGGVHFHSNNGTDVAYLGAGGGATASFLGGVNIDGATRLATNMTGIIRADAGVLSTTTGVASGGSNWLFNGSRLTPSTTVGIGVFASSTIGDGTATGGLLVNGPNVVKYNTNTNGPLTVTNTRGSGTIVPVATFEWDDARGAGTNNYDAYIDFKLSDSASNQQLASRMQWTLNSVTNNSETATLLFQGYKTGSFNNWLSLGSYGGSAERMESFIPIQADSTLTVTGTSTLATTTMTVATSTSLYTTTLGLGSGNYFTSLLGSGLVNTSGSLTCTTANASTFGCLTAADWTIFNNKVSSTSIDTSAEIAALVTDETGTGNLVFSNAPTLTGSTTMSALGIGASAQSLLHVRTDGVNASTSGLTLQNRNSTLNTEVGINFITSATDVADQRFAYIGGINTNGATSNGLVFKTGAGAAPSERMRIDSSGFVGIGTTSPSRLLTLYQENTPVLQLADSTSGSLSTDGLLIYQSGLNASIENQEAGYLKFRTSATDRMTIDSSGNVGIGTTTPNNKLSVLGDFQLGNTSTSAGVRMFTTGSYVDIVGINHANNAYNDIVLRTGATPTLYMNTTGNVGIGSTTPSANLTVTGSGTQNSFVVASSSGATQIAVLPSGFVGLGTNAPISALHVRGTQFTLDNGSSNIYARMIQNYSSSYVTLEENNNGTLSQLKLSVAGGASNYATFNIGGKNDIGYFSSYRTFGINTNAPVATAHFLSGSTTIPTMITQATTSQTANLQEWRNSSGNILNMIGIDGKVGIGTNAPGYNMTIRNDTTGSTTTLTLENRASATGGLSTTTIGFATGNSDFLTRGAYISAFGGNSSVLSFATGNGTPPAEVMRITESATVGIGATAPTQKLEINGGVRLNTATAKPTCNSSARGTFWAVQSGAGVKDTVEVCAKDAADAYAWRTIY